MSIFEAGFPMRRQKTASLKIAQKKVNPIDARKEIFLNFVRSNHILIAITLF